MATKRQQEDMRLIHNALLTLKNCTDYDIIYAQSTVVDGNDEIIDVVSAIYSFWAAEELGQALASNGDD